MATVKKNQKRECKIEKSNGLKSRELNCDGTEHVCAEEYEIAVNIFNKAIELDSKNAGPWVNKITSLLLMGKREEAIKCIKKAEEIDEVRNHIAWTRTIGPLKKMFELG